MLHIIFSAYNAAPPRTKRAARAGAAFLAGAALAVLATACSPAYAQPADRGTIAPKPRGPVIETTISEAVAAPTEKRGFVSPKFSRCRHSGIGMVSGGMGLPVRMAARLRTCVSTSRPPAAIETANGGFLVTPEGAKTMTATPVASASARTPTTNAPTEEERAYALLQALSSASLARLYLHKNNVPAARRQAVLLLKTLQTLEAA